MDSARTVAQVESIQVVRQGQNGWDAVAREFNNWAVENSRPKREVKPLKAKYDYLVRLASEKPTGKATVPWYLEKAGKVEKRIQERSNTGELNDDEDNAVVEGSGSVVDAGSDDEDAHVGDGGSASATSDSDSDALGGAMREWPTSRMPHHPPPVVHRLKTSLVQSQLHLTLPLGTLEKMHGLLVSWLKMRLAV
ncbi:hypothetical protein BV20DRAFT_1058584 [Pilatotrama ljubarskyi]|nr:hypothetical protein BV20DRAFT_1058584 [Pilatotrama ljubarskyi]